MVHLLNIVIISVLNVCDYDDNDDDNQSAEAIQECGVVRIDFIFSNL